MTESRVTHAYGGERFSLLTQHGKERIMAPLFAESLGAELELATGFDTDSLGTFTRDIARQGDQLEAARKKAEKGMDLVGVTCGVASEGAFGPGPFGFFSWNVELVVMVDRVRGIEIVGCAQGAAHHLHQQLTTRDARGVGLSGGADRRRRLLDALTPNADCDLNNPAKRCLFPQFGRPPRRART